MGKKGDFKYATIRYGGKMKTIAISPSEWKAIKKRSFTSKSKRK